jgi:hypothetical protein
MSSAVIDAWDTHTTSTASSQRLRLRGSVEGTVWHATHRTPRAVFPMDALLELAARGENDKALDLVFDTLDDLLLDGRVSDCEATLRAVDPARLPPVVAVGFLAITRSAEDRLRDARAALRRRIEATYQHTMPAERLEQLLRGL